MSGFFIEKSNKLRFFVMKAMFLLTCLCLAFSTIINPISIRATETFSCYKTAQATNIPSFQEIIKTLFNKKEKTHVQKEKKYVYLGGYPLGFTINCSGVVVIAISNDTAVNLKEGDIISHINGSEISSSLDISKIINEQNTDVKNLKLDIIRNGKKEYSTISAILDSVTQKYKLGLWIRDNSAGVGTLSYIRKDNLRFGALGHPVCDIDTGCLMPVSSGNIFKCNNLL